jgi:hypothetical protein
VRLFRNAPVQGYASRAEAAATSTAHRLRALLKAGVALNSELSLDGLLQRSVELAAELTGARFRAHIMRKLRLGSRAELVRYALAEGYLAD